MALEIERKFLVRGSEWRVLVQASQRLRDGLLASSDESKVRVRLYGDQRATLTVKSTRLGLERSEFEYEVPVADAFDMLTNQCSYRRLEKTRHELVYGGWTWHIDEYEGLLAGTIIAEVELDRPDAEVSCPPWLGAEITHDPAYKKLNMLKAALAKQDEPVAP